MCEYENSPLAHHSIGRKPLPFNIFITTAKERQGSGGGVRWSERIREAGHIYKGSFVIDNDGNDCETCAALCVCAHLEGAAVYRQDLLCCRPGQESEITAGKLTLPLGG